MNVFDSSTGVRTILLQIRDGDATAIERLFAYSLERLQLLSNRIFNIRKDLHHYEEADDLFQDALIRLHATVTKLKPVTTRALMALALQHIRWALGDLARELHQKKWQIPAIESHQGFSEPPDLDGEPQSLLEWQNFHEMVEQLPTEEKEVFDAIFYGGARQEEVAEMLQVSTRTVKRRWRAARILLLKKLDGDWPPIA